MPSGCRIVHSIWRASLKSSSSRQLKPWRQYAQVSAADLQFGQPVHETHPHLLGAGELTRGITASEYYHRREKLAALLPENSVAILSASEVKYRSGPVFYPFHQNTDFFYLTGFQEPEALAVIDKRSSDTAFHLMVREKDEHAELWEGVRSGTQAAIDVFNADHSGNSSFIHNLLPQILDGAEHLFTDLYPPTQSRTGLGRYLVGPGSASQSTFSNLVKDLKARPGLKVQSLKRLMSKLRVIKSDAEVNNMRLAGKISGRVITDAMRQSWKTESDLHAFLDYQFRVKGCESEAYVPVVANGKNALSIHYVRNDSLVENSNTILVDAGGSYGGYITDITRTWPNSGKFSDAQRGLYETVLGVQRSCVTLCRQDATLSLDDIHKVAAKSLKDGLKDLGFDVSGNAMDVLFPHHVGHHIGLDVHDCPEISRKEKLLTNMCVTIEPGVYVPDDQRWPAPFRGIGIRIEDSICVLEENPFVLTTEAVKEVVDIEALRS